MTTNIQKENKFRFGLGFYLNFGLSIVFASAAIFLINQININERDQALLEAETKARLILDRNLATHTYFSQILKPTIFDLTKTGLDEDYFEPAWMSSTYAVREIENNFKSLNDEEYYYKECAINARSPENEADEFEKAFIEELNTNPKLQYRSLVRNLDGAYYYVTLRRGEVMKKNCLQCHSTPDKAPKGLLDVYGPGRSFKRSANDVVSAISIRVPLSTAYKKADRFSDHLSKMFLVVLLTMFVVQYFIYRFFILQPITTLKDTALNISKNDDLLGEEILLPVSREFAELSSSFNTMSKKLRYQLDHLEEAVEERTTELKSSNKNLQEALGEIKTLRGILPVCSYCKNIRDDKGYWSQIEAYISTHSEAQFSHSICPDCLKKHHNETYESLGLKGKIQK